VTAKFDFIDMWVHACFLSGAIPLLGILCALSSYFGEPITSIEDAFLSFSAFSGINDLYTQKRAQSSALIKSI
jgi:hypothetical protein